MTADECRARARACRVEAFRAWGKLRADLTALAREWDALADELDASGLSMILVTETAEGPGRGR